MRLSQSGITLLGAITAVKAGAFLKVLNDTHSIIGNDLWNVTQGRQYATQLYFKGSDLVKNSTGHYVSYNGAASDLNWTSVAIAAKGDNWIDVRYNAKEGEFHWVIYDDLVGAYQYFVNKALPTLGEFRTLWRLDNATFPKGKTYLKDDTLPPLSDYVVSTKVQDETWQRADGTYITKYDWSAFIRDEQYYGVYGDSFGSWYINPGKDEYNGNHLKQELMVHRESATGHAVQLNMIHGTHFQASATDVFPTDKVWGPWLWYLNDGSKDDAAQRAITEFHKWPYPWFNNTAYHSRGSVCGTVKLADGRPAAGAYVFLGDNHPNKTSLDMGSDYYYTGYADEEGRFEFRHVREANYGFQAWSNGGQIADVANTFLHNDVSVTAGETTDLATLTWTPRYESTNEIFRVGDFDRKSIGFLHGGAPYQHGLVENCPANVNFTIGVSDPAKDWCFGQSANGTWTINFPYRPEDMLDASNSSLLLTVALAGYSQGTTSNIYINGIHKIGNLTSIPSDPSLYRSGTTAGEAHLLEFPVPSGLLKDGWNTVDFKIATSTRWRGFMWDAISLARV